MSRAPAYRPSQRPTRISNARASQTGALIFFGLLFIAQIIPTEVFAWQVGFAAWLGRPLVPAPAIYIPGQYLFWLLLLHHPVYLTRLPFIAMTPTIAKAITSLPYSIGAALLGAVALSVVVIRAEAARIGSVESIYDAEARFVESKAEAREQGLTEPAGFVLGYMANGTLLRYSGSLGYEHIDPPDQGKSAVMTTNLLIPLQHAAARREWADLSPAQRFLARTIMPSLKPWTEKQRRVHPYGKEPLILATDPKFEFSFKAAGYQHDVLGKQVEILAPFGVPKTYTDYTGEIKPFPIPEQKLACYNPLWAARLGQDRGYQDYYAKTLAIVDKIGKVEKDNSHWDDAATGWGAALSEHLAFVALNTGNYEMLSYPGMLDYLSSFKEEEVEVVDEKNAKEKKAVMRSAMDVLLHDMMTYEHDQTADMLFGWERLRNNGAKERTRHKPSIYNAAHRMLAKDIRERSAVFSTWMEKLNLFASDALRRYTVRSTFEFKALANDPRRSATVFIGANPMDMAELQPYFRMVYEDFFRDLTYGGTPEIDGQSVRPNIYPAIALQEEAYVIGYNVAVDKSSGFVRGFGVYIAQLWQSVAQRKKVYNRDGHDIIGETIAVHLYGASMMKEAANFVVEELGNRGHMIVNENLSGERFDISPFSQVSEHATPVELALMGAKEFQSMPKSHYVAIVRGRNYILEKPVFWRNQTLLKRSQMEPKISGENNVKEPFFVRSVREVIGDAGMAEILALQKIASANAIDDEQSDEQPEGEPESIVIESPIRELAREGDYALVRARSAVEAIVTSRGGTLADLRSRLYPKPNEAA